MSSLFDSAEAKPARSIGRKVLLVLLGLALACAAYAVFIEPNRLQVNEKRIALPSWPEKLKGLRIVALSDLHVGSPFIDLAKLTYIVEQTNAAQPDLIVITGDLVIQEVLGGKFVAPELIAEKLQALRAKHGVFATLGNHDHWYDGPRVQSALEGAEIKVLENDAARIEINGEPLWIVGFGDAWTGSPNTTATLRKVSDQARVLAITHNPDLFTRIPDRVALTIAGHTHGGQVALPLLGRLVVPSDYGQRYAVGYIVEDGRHLFVTSGVGTSILPVRFGVPPEISLLVIQ